SGPGRRPSRTRTRATPVESVAMASIGTEAPSGPTTEMVRPVTGRPPPSAAWNESVTAEETCAGATGSPASVTHAPTASPVRAGKAPVGGARGAERAAKDPAAEALAGAGRPGHVRPVADLTRVTKPVAADRAMWIARAGRVGTIGHAVAVVIDEVVADLLVG